MANGRRKPEAEEDKLVATYLAIRDYAVHHRSALLLIAAAVIVGVAVSALVANSRAKTRLEIEVQISEAVFLIQAMQHQRGALLLESILERHSGGDLGADIRYHLASAQFLSGNTRRALELYQDMLATQPKDPLRRFSASEGIAQCHEAEGQFAAAAEAYEKLASEAPGNPAGPLALANAARCYENAGNLAAAKRLAHRLRDEFPQNQQWQREGIRLAARMAALEAPEGQLSRE